MGRLNGVVSPTASGPGRWSPGLFCSLLAASWMLALQAPAASLPEGDGATLSIEPVGKTAISAPPSVYEMSGITYAGPVSGGGPVHRFYAVTDSHPVVCELDVTIDHQTGRVRSARVTDVLKLSDCADCEGIAYDPATGNLFVSDESGPAIRLFHGPGAGRSVAGTKIRSLTIPDVLRRPRLNLSLEPLSLQAWGLSLWSANEEALPADGPTSTPESGTTVRLLKYGPDLEPCGQWAYVTDPVGTRSPRGHSQERSGVCDLTVLPDGTLLVLERGLDVEKFLIAEVPVFTARIHAVDFAGASEVSPLASLTGAQVSPVGKRLLWSRNFGLREMNNFEGMALGPRLADGSWSIVLVSDDEKGKLEQSLFTLRVRFRAERMTGESAAQSPPPAGWVGDIEGRVAEISEDGRTLKIGGESAKERVTVRTVYPATVTAGMAVLAYGRWLDEGVLDALSVIARPGVERDTERAEAPATP